MRSLSQLRFFLGVLVLSCACLTSCSTAKAPRSQSNPDIVKLTAFWHPELLYILPSPYSRLYVELGQVEGSIQRRPDVNKLRAFFATYCHKPNGIEIVRGDVI